jgi:hypothetical protein
MNFSVCSVVLVLIVLNKKSEHDVHLAVTSLRDSAFVYMA